MSLSTEAIDRIVANVLKQISSNGPVEIARATPKPVDASLPAPPSGQSVTLTEAVITGALLENIAVEGAVRISPKAIVTPAAWDVIRARRLQLQRGSAGGEVSKTATVVAPAVAVPAVQPLLIMVRSSKVMDQVWEGLANGWKRELLGCPDDAAKLAISEICRGSSQQIVILAEQTYRAACLANRNERVKAVAIQDVGEIKVIRKQIRANVWCLDPGNRSFFELKNLFQQIGSEPGK